MMEAEPLLADSSSVNSDDGRRSADMQRSSWQDSTFILIGLIMGSGTLGLPYAMAQLGWYIGISVCVLFGIAAIYSGLLLAAVRNRFCPEAENFSDAATTVLGPRFGAFTQWAIWTNWTLLLPYYLMSSTQAIELAVGKSVLCFPEMMMCIMAAMLLLLQLRTLHSLTWLAAASGGAITLAMVLMLIDFGLYGGGFNNHNVVTDRWPKLGLGLLDAYGSTASFIFAFQGQSVFLEIMREMKNSREFPKSITAANSVMIIVYLSIIILCYLAKGDEIPDFAPNAVTNETFRSVVGGLVAFNLLSSYLLTNVPLALALHERIAPATARDFQGWRARVEWFILTGTLLLFSFVVANAIPFFGAFQGIIGAALGAPILFGWPPAFYLLGAYRIREKVSAIDGVLCRLFVYLIFPMCCSLGLYAAVRSLALSWGDNNHAPFDCHP